jgi:hypothetical protein
VAPELANLPDLPEETAHIWQWYCDLSSARGAGFSINAIAWTDIWAYFDLKRMRPEPWEVQTIRALDDAFLVSRIDEATGSVAGAKSLKSRMTGKAAQ